MDWLNLHISVLDSPQVLRCDPVRRATWLFLLRYCISQENGGLIADCAAWGDTSWQQIVRVKLKEVRAESPLWTWEGNNLRVTFYPSEKETEVQAKRELARTNGQRGGRPKKTDAATNDETDRKPTSVNSPKAEGNGKEGKGIGKEVSAAAPPQASETGVAADPLGMESVPPAPAPPPVPPGDWIDWKRSRRIYISRSDESGNLDDWRDLFRTAGPKIMAEAYAALIPAIPPPKGVGYVAMQRWIFDHYQEQKP